MFYHALQCLLCLDRQQFDARHGGGLRRGVSPLRRNSRGTQSPLGRPDEGRARQPATAAHPDEHDGAGMVKNCPRAKRGVGYTNCHALALQLYKCDNRLVERQLNV